MNALAQPVAEALPVNLDAEAALLGAILVDNRAHAAVAGLVEGRHFGEALHGQIYDLCAALIADGRRASPVTLNGALPADLKIGDLTPMQYLAHLAAEATTIINAADYGRIVYEAAIRRDLITLGTTLAESARLFGAGVRDTIADAEVELLRLADDAQRADPAAAAPPMDFDRVIADIAEGVRSGQKYIGARSGLIDLDNRLGGFGPGDLIVLAGRPGMGKTALALSLARAAAKHGGIGFDTLEMSEAQLRSRLLSDEAFDDRQWIEYERIRKRQLKDAEVDALLIAGERLKRLPLAIVDRGNRLSDIPGHIRQARRMLARQGRELDLFILDYLGLVAPGDRYKGHKTAEVTEISATLKSLAKREGIPILALHQLNRQSEGRDDHRPRLSELRDSGGLEQDADMVIFVHREAYYLERPGYGGPEGAPERQDALAACKNTMEAIIAKNRHGAIGSVMLYCDMSVNAVRDRAR